MGLNRICSTGIGRMLGLMKMHVTYSMLLAGIKHFLCWFVGMSIDLGTHHTTRSQNRIDHSHDRCLQSARQKIAHHRFAESAYRECKGINAHGLGHLAQAICCSHKRLG